MSPQGSTNPLPAGPGRGENQKLQGSSWQICNDPNFSTFIDIHRHFLMRRISPSYVTEVIGNFHNSTFWHFSTFLNMSHMSGLCWSHRPKSEYSKLNISPHFVTHRKRAKNVKVAAGGNLILKWADLIHFPNSILLFRYYSYLRWVFFVYPVIGRQSWQNSGNYVSKTEYICLWLWELLNFLQN